jgi:Protein of unknown function (DUF3179)
MTASLTHRSRRAYIPVLLACLAGSLISVAYPLYVIRPFRAQGAGELAAALVVARFEPLLTAISACVALLAMVGYSCEQPRLWRRVVAAGGACCVAALAVLARVNVYERMFHPIEHSSFAIASQVKLDGDEKVIAVSIGGEARAYPIRNMSYHHMINDVVGRVAIVATY